MEKYSDNFMANYLASVALHNPNGVVVVYGDKRLTWKELDDRSNRMAQALIEKGVRKGDKVLFMFHNRPEFLEVNYAVMKCGAIPVPLNYRFTAPEIEFQADHSDGVVFILEDIWLDEVQKARPKLEKVKHYICFGSECPSDMIDYDSIMKDYPPDDPNVPTDEDDIAVICYTGGTTGFPKGVMLTYKAHLEMFRGLAVSLIMRIVGQPLKPETRKRISESSNMPGIGLVLSMVGRWPFNKLLQSPKTVKILNKRVGGMLRNLKLLRRGYSRSIKVMFPSMPFFHDASYQMTVTAPIVGNQTFLLTEGVKFDPKKVLEMVEREKPVMLANVPTGWKMIADFPDLDKYDISSIAFCVAGAGLSSVDLKKKILSIFKGALYLDMFGQTEMAPLTSFRMDADAEGLTDRSVGKPIFDTRIVDEDGKDAAQGEIGEIIYKSPTIMKGYYKDEEQTAEVIKDGWFYSGDLGYFDEKGEIRVAERKKECINTGGEKVFPMEVEQVIEAHPSVHHICIIGIPDEKWGSSIRAVVELKKGKQAAAEEIIAMCDGKLAGYKKPRSVKFVDELPLSPVGKVLRSKIREKYGQP